jgi:cysteine desulfurase
MIRIYLDNNATTGVDPRVLDAMMDDLSGIPANPSSVHHFGQEARKQIARARQTISGILHVKPHELIFTSGGTEALNMILRGISGGHILTSDVEHSAVFNTLQMLEKKGAKATYLPAGLWGAVRPEQIEEAIRKETKLIVLSAVNNETGVKIDLEKIANLAKQASIPFVVDAVSLLGKESFKIHDGISAMAFSGHKLHAPKGIGLAFIRSHFKFDPLLTGGDQEFSKRAGTENLSGILGLAKAIELLKTELPEATHQMQKLRDRLIEGLMEKLGNIVVHGQGPRIANTANISFPGAEGESLLMKLDLAGIAVSHGSACSSGALEPSRILRNMGIPANIARSSLRFSLSRFTTQEEIDTCIEIIVKLIPRKGSIAH